MNCLRYLYERLFAAITDRTICRSSFSSAPNLKQRVMPFVDAYKDTEKALGLYAPAPTYGVGSEPGSPTPCKNAFFRVGELSAGPVCQDKTGHGLR